MERVSKGDSQLSAYDQACKPFVATRGVRHIKRFQQAALTLFSILQSTNLIVWSTGTGVQSRASIVAAVLSLATAVALIVLSYLEHVRSLRPSSTINAYLLLSVPCDAAKVRTLWLRGGSSLLAGIVSAMLVIKLLVLVVEAGEKRRILLSTHTDISPEDTSGLYSRSLFWWLNPILLTGYKCILRDVDLFPADESLTSESLRKRFQARWTRREQSSILLLSVTLLTTCREAVDQEARAPSYDGTQYAWTFTRCYPPTLVPGPLSIHESASDTKGDCLRQSARFREHEIPGLGLSRSLRARLCWPSGVRRSASSSCKQDGYHASWCACLFDLHKGHGPFDHVSFDIL